ncbi:MAG: hypothetical protein CVU43_02955 [Chloroflexi bacterium HGW-Chloroflexi-5]|jgi:ubiquinone/menaquinone biosynthesis C-methylase UbiE|nr:MAG: hypothetical protein CVU43_02955 [Chloroflexi bacterium HGW-Chloroflexi-5]
MFWREMMSREQQIGAKPAGIAGTLAGRLMNLIHKKEYSIIIKAIQSRSELPVSTILDIGCGGGAVVKEFSRQFSNAQVIGVDHSAEMVRLSQKTNKSVIKTGRVKIQQNGVEKIEIESNKVDLITAFDTINFWPDYDLAFGEIKRVLSTGGRFIIVNGYPPVGSRWYEFDKFKDEHEYRSFLAQHGFEVSHLEVKNQTIIIESKKKAS